ncbi:Amino Acid/Auxin Permease (AAAP) Family [Achlya hypogyna]|uniref:Amino Acid/Auxin Permease (AAAP) Family n=1 Tax=Achlya hypogyna TaxID=1202772 RepID=A0A1V9ZRB3_ACHHY|nr:Amino Acid/Auxin Permease (AAAP) Family [Achlya hypogyna]
MKARPRPASAGATRRESVGSPLERRFSAVAYSAAWPTTFGQGAAIRLTSPDFRRLLPHSSRASTASEASPLLSPNAADGNGFWDATCTVVNVLVGAGLLSLPYMLRCSGVVLGLCLLLVFGVVANFTGKLLGACMASDARIRSYPDVVNAAFGLTGRRIASILCFVELFVACTMFLVLVADSLHVLFPVHSAPALLSVAFACVLPTTWLADLSRLSALSVLGVVSSVALVLLLLFAGWTTPAGQPGSLWGNTTARWLVDNDAWALSIGLALVGFAGHAVFPSIYLSMDDPAMYPAVLNVGYAAVGTTYALVALAGYVMFGAATSKEITLNLLAVSPGWATTAVMWTVVLNPCTKFAIVLHPIALSVEELVLPWTLPEASSERMQHAQRCVLRSLLSLGTFVVALKVPNFVQWTSLLGALFATAIVVVVPCLCYWKLFRSTLHWCSTLALLGLVLATVVLGTLGVVATATNASADVMQ